MKKNYFYLWLNGELDKEKVSIPFSFLFPTSYVRYLVIPTINGEINGCPVVLNFEQLEEIFSLYGECTVYAIDFKELKSIEISLFC